MTVVEGPCGKSQTVYDHRGADFPKNRRALLVPNAFRTVVEYSFNSRGKLLLSRLFIK